MDPAMGEEKELEEVIRNVTPICVIAWTDGNGT